MPYCILMDGLSKSGKVDEAKSLFDRMNERRVRSGIIHSVPSSEKNSFQRFEFVVVVENLPF